MSFLHSVLSLPREGLIIAGVVVAALLAIWLFTMLSRQRFVTIKRSEETELMLFHIRRIADAVERLATARETPAQVEPNANKRVGISMSAR